MDSLLIGKMAPYFKAKALVRGQIVDDFSLEDFLGKYLFFFFYPLDFTFVCPTELHSFQELSIEFEKRDAQIVGCSVDSPYAHLAWSLQPRKRGGVEGVSYPLVSDLTKEIARAYRVLNEEQGIAYRAQFLLDKKGIIRHQLINDLPIGRSGQEALRLLDALIFHETHGSVCPANWKAGEATMVPTQEGLLSYFEETAVVT